MTITRRRRTPETGELCQELQKRTCEPGVSPKWLRPTRFDIWSAANSLFYLVAEEGFEPPTQGL
jgi:hypothetical protein